MAAWSPSLRQSRAPDHASRASVRKWLIAEWARQSDGLPGSRAYLRDPAGKSGSGLQLLRRAVERLPVVAVLFDQLARLLTGNAMLLREVGNFVRLVARDAAAVRFAD